MATRTFGHSWWGASWVDALEHRAGLEANRLPRGRTYARQGRVVRLDVEAGKITALVRGGRALPYRVTVSLPTYSDTEWARVAQAIAARAQHAAALLDGELDPGVATETEAAGVRLFPSAGELSFRCSCPDWADPCKHALAVCYQVADALDEDPFVLFALRGGARDDLLELVRLARVTGVGRAPDGPASPDGPVGSDATGSAPGERLPGTGPGGSGRLVAATFGGGAVVDPGTIAREAWARTPSPIPPRRELPPAPGAPAPWPTDPPPDAPFTAAGLQDLANDAAQRAWAQLADGAPSHLALDEAADLARLAADRLDRLERVLDLSRRAGVPGPQLTHQALAWRHAGADGVEAIDEALWRPPDSVVAQGLEAFDEAGIDPEEVQVRSNRLTHGEVQLRVTSDGRWWRYERRGRTWELVEPPAPHPDDLLGAGDL